MSRRGPASADRRRESKTATLRSPFSRARPRSDDARYHEWVLQRVDVVVTDPDAGHGQLVARHLALEAQRVGALGLEVEPVDMTVVVEAVRDGLAVGAQGDVVATLELHRPFGQRLA